MNTKIFDINKNEYIIASIIGNNFLKILTDYSLEEILDMKNDIKKYY